MQQTLKNKLAETIKNFMGKKVSMPPMKKTPEKQERAIMLFADKKYFFALCTFIINIKQYIKYDCIVVYHTDLNEEDQIIAKKFEKNINFIKYDYKDFAEEFGSNEDTVKSIQSIKDYSLSMLRFKIFKHLREFKMVILLELDMLLRGDLSELFDKDYNIAWKADNVSISGKLQAFGYSIEKMKELGMYEIYSKATTPNAGFIIVKDNFDYELAYAKAYEFFKKYFFEHPYLMGELNFGYIRYILNLKLYEVDPTVYNAFPHLITTKSKLIHFFRNTKPWDNDYIQFIFNDWVRNYIKYTEVSQQKSDRVTIFENIGSSYLASEYCHRKLKKFNIYGLRYPRDLKMGISKDNNVISFTYSQHVIYDIRSNFMDNNSCVCRLWIIRGAQNEKTLQEKIAELVNTGEFNYIEYTNSFGCQTKRTDLNKAQQYFDNLYEATSIIREISKNN